MPRNAQRHIAFRPEERIGEPAMHRLPTHRPKNTKKEREEEIEVNVLEIEVLLWQTGFV